MNDPTRVAEIDSIDELKHKELNLMRGDGGFIVRQIFFKVIIGKLKDEMEFLFIRMINNLH